jgi:hypothetical protein
MSEPLNDATLAAKRQECRLNYCMQQLVELATGRQSNAEKSPARLLAVALRQWHIATEDLAAYLRSVERRDLVEILSWVPAYQPESLETVTLGVCPVCGGWWQLVDPDVSEPTMKAHPHRGPRCSGSGHTPRMRVTGPVL